MLGPAVALAFAAGALLAQERPQLVTAAVHVDASNGDDVRVVARFALVATRSLDSLQLRAIPFFGVIPGTIEATVDGARVDVVLERRGGALAAAVSVPTEAAPDRAIVIDLQYVATGAVVRHGPRLDIRIPVVYVDAVPVSSADDFFAAELRLPPGATVIESFPTVPRVHDTDGGGERYASKLQVVPSLLRWRATEGPAPWLSFEAGVDAALIVAIVGFVALGARALARSG